MTQENIPNIPCAPPLPAVDLPAHLKVRRAASKSGRLQVQPLEAGGCPSSSAIIGQPWDFPLMLLPLGTQRGYRQKKEVQWMSVL